MTTSGAAVPGWYPDPYNPSLLRYWDGQTWSEHTAPAGGGGGQFDTGSGVRSDGTLGDVGDWLSSTFKVVIDRIVPVLILGFVVPAVGYTAFFLVLFGAFRGVVIDVGSEEITGFSAGRLLALVPIGLVLVVAGGVAWLGLNHQLYHAHAGQPRSVGRSLAAGLSRLPRAIGWGLVLWLAAVVLMGVLFVGPFILAVAVDGAFALLLILAIPVLFVVGVWLAVRLSYTFVAVAVTPWGTNPVTTSTSLVKDRWWGTFGRLLLLGVIIWFVSLAFQITGNIAGTAVPFTNVATDPATGEVTVDGEPISEDEPLVVDDLLPGTVALVVAGLFTALSQGVTQALSVSGVTGLYRRAGGPADAGT